MNSPLIKLERWLKNEKENGNVFPQGAVLCTNSKEGIPRSRVVSTMLDEELNPVFHTSPVSRKVEDIEFCNKVSLTYSFQSTLRSVSIEASLVRLNDSDLETDWRKFDYDFRKHYIVFGSYSGNNSISMESLRSKRDALIVTGEESRPDSFIGYRLIDITRMSFYSVKDGDFAESLLFERNPDMGGWNESTVVP